MICVRVGVRAPWRPYGVYIEGGEGRGSHLHSFVSQAVGKKVLSHVERGRDSRSLRGPATHARRTRRSRQPARTARGSPHATPTATQNPGLSELGGRERALGHRRHRGGRRGLPPGHSMAHTCSSQNRTERWSPFGLFERHFGCFQWGQLRLRANMNRLRVQR